MDGNGIYTLRFTLCQRMYSAYLKRIAEAYKNDLGRLIAEDPQLALEALVECAQTVNPETVGVKDSEGLNVSAWMDGTDTTNAIVGQCVVRAGSQRTQVIVNVARRRFLGFLSGPKFYPAEEVASFTLG